ncbi:hypothetical protein C8R44DRAFT_778112 [Mycena epipterygia]|nr:hypothetical protein C8R44DRAFT_778112 [Mycena epipterygia]
MKRQKFKLCVYWHEWMTCTRIERYIDVCIHGFSITSDTHNVSPRPTCGDPQWPRHTLNDHTRRNAREAVFRHHTGVSRHLRHGTRRVGRDEQPRPDRGCRCRCSSRRILAPIVEFGLRCRGRVRSPDRRQTGPAGRHRFPPPVPRDRGTPRTAYTNTGQAHRHTPRERRGTDGSHRV